MDITVQELKERLDKGDKFVFIDVREQHEYDEFNLGATLIPLGNIQTSIDDLEEHKEEQKVGRVHGKAQYRVGD